MAGTESLETDSEVDKIIKKMKEYWDIHQKPPWVKADFYEYCEIKTDKQFAVVKKEKKHGLRISRDGTQIIHLKQGFGVDPNRDLVNILMLAAGVIILLGSVFIDVKFITDVDFISIPVALGIFAAYGGKRGKGESSLLGDNSSNMLGLPAGSVRIFIGILLLLLALFMAISEHDEEGIKAIFGASAELIGLSLYVVKSDEKVK